MHRRSFLRAAGIAGATLLAPPARLLSPAIAQEAPQTGFEQRNGASWTTHDEELQFLDAVAAGSPRVSIREIGRSLRDRPLHVVSLGDPVPHEGLAAIDGPVTLFVCSQHGNEPAGRETGLALLRDLAFTTDPVLVQQLREQTILVIPSANPDGRAANTRGNANGTDINRDHLGLRTPEAQAIHSVIRDLRPHLILDLHEYGPSVPVLYDDDILYLWPRNLNVDPQVRDLSRTLAREYIAKGAIAAGYTADEYGLYKVANEEVTQTAGGPDEGICRNAVGLRHSLGILVESAVTQNPRRGVDELTSEAAVNRRRVASQRQVTADTLRFMREQGDLAEFASESSPLRAARETRPIYWGGADNEPPAEGDVTDPPPCAYRLTEAQASDLEFTFALHGITSVRKEDGVYVPLAQPARPVIPLLLDDRGSRNVVAAEPTDCV